MAQTQQCACCSSTTTTEDELEVTCYCAVDDLLDTVGRKYAMQVIAILGARGPTRYSTLEDALEVTSASTFSDCLSELVEAALIERRSFDEIPPRVEYSLTAKGRSLETRLQPLLEWTEETST